MPSEHQIFRLVLLVWIALFLPVGLWFRIRSHTGEPLDRRQEGWFSLVALRVLGGIGFAGLVAWLAGTTVLDPLALPLANGLRWTGLLLGFCGGLLVLWTFRSLGSNLTDTVVTRKHHTLVTSGPYRWVRHPLYTCAVLLVLGNTLATANAFFLLVGLPTVLLLMLRTRKEEANLLTRFGEDYRAYRERAGRFLPRF